MRAEDRSGSCLEPGPEDRRSRGPARVRSNPAGHRPVTRPVTRLVTRPKTCDENVTLALPIWFDFAYSFGKTLRLGVKVELIPGVGRDEEPINGVYGDQVGRLDAWRSDTTT